ncbi:MAG: ester cyclase [Rhizonema sp. PD37]|nr:ester cyclase [Rhizonema sp. PD37]
MSGINEQNSDVQETPAIFDVPGTDINKFMSHPNEKRQSMQGFDEDYVDIVDYIIRCTHKIWEERNMGLIYSHYAHNVVTQTMDGITYGRDQVIADSIKLLAAFPDVRLFGEDVIWSGNDRDGFHSSHRITWVAHNTGYSIYGPPTGRRVTYLIIAHCYVKENRIIQEWIARNELAVIRQLGFDEFELARKMVERDYAAGIKSPVPVGTGEVDRVLGQTTPQAIPEKSAAFDPENFIQRFYQEVWNWRMFGKLNEYFVPNYMGHLPTNRELYGLGDLSAYITQMIAAFPDACILVDHVCTLGNEQEGYRIAVRWTMQGTHQGPGYLGEAKGRRVNLMGISHYLVKNGKVLREWTTYDEFALLKQTLWPV